MSNVEFSEEQAYTTALNQMGKAPASGLRALPIKLGLAKDEAGADIVLASIAVLAAVLAIAVFLFSGRTSSVPGAVAPIGANGMPPGMPSGVPTPGVQP